MGILFTHQGSHISTVRHAGIRLNEVAEMGRVGSSTVSIEDEAGTQSIIGHKAFRVWESDCSQPRTLRGFVTDHRYRRDVRRVGASRIIDVDLVDLNAKLGFKVIRGAAWRKRPKETIGERLTDLLASGFLNVEDNGFVEYPDTMLDGGDLRGQRPGDVLMDMATRAGFNFFVYWDEAQDETSLWFQDSNTSTDFSSTLRISNVLADIDTGTAATFLTGTTFAASHDTELRRSPAQTVSGVWVPYKRRAVYRTRAATEDEFEPRDGTAPNSNIKRRARAIAVGDRFLRHHRNEEDRITTQIQVPSSKVNLVRAGQRIEAKFSHFAEEGYGDFTWFRVLERTVTMPVPDDDLYNISMVLSPQEEGSSGPSLVQYKGVDNPNNDSLDMDDPVTVGHLLVSVLIQLDPIGTPEMVAGHGWTLLGTASAEPDADVSDREGAVAIWAKVADSTSTFMEREATSARMQMWVYELSGASIANSTVLDQSNVLVNTAAAFTADLGTFGEVEGVAVSGWTFTQSNPGAGQTLAVVDFASGWTRDYADYVDPPPAYGNPWAVVGHSSLTTPTVLDPSVTCDEVEAGQTVYQWAGVAVMFE